MRKITFLIVAILLTVLTIDKSYASILFEDDFNDIDNTPLTLHNILWQAEPSYDFGLLINNKVRSSNHSNAGYFIPSLDNLTDYCVQEDFVHPLPQTFPLDFLGLSTRRGLGLGQHYYEAQIAANDNLYFFKFNDFIDSNYQLLHQQQLSITNGVHTAKLCSVGSNHSFYIDNQLITTITDSSYLSGAPGFKLGNNTSIDNFIVDSVSADLNVPLLKQTDARWGAQIYDSADIWNPQNDTISSWGCAITSVAMVLNYYGIHNLPDGTPLDPGTLNTWLKSRSDGYVDGGIINWTAIQTLAKLAKDSGYNPGFAYDSLEFQWTGHDTSLLTNDLNNGHPDILEEEKPQHFIVATGVNDSTFDINDPYNNYESLDDYGNTFKGMRRYIPAYSDLSYLQFVVNQDVNVKLTDDNGNVVGEEHIEEPLEADGYPGQTSGVPLKIVLLPKPNTGIYHLTLTSPHDTSYKLTSYLYTEDGEVTMSTDRGFVGGEDVNTFTINFDKKIQGNNTHHKDVTFASMITDINEGVSLNLIKDTGEKSLLSLLENSQNDVAKGNLIPALNKLDAFGNELNAQKGKSVQQEAYDVLSSDLFSLQTSLQ